MEPSGHADLYGWLAYGHPVWMVAAIATAVLALRAGLVLRRGRLARRPRPAAALHRHTRLGKRAVVLVLLGFGAGPVSMALLRGRDPFGTAHALVAVLVAGLFIAVAILGRRLERGQGRPVQAHALLALLATLAAAAALGTGLVLLP